MKKGRELRSWDCLDRLERKLAGGVETWTDWARTTRD